MTNEQIKEYLADRGYEDALVFENPDYASAFIGVSDDGRAIYDYDLMVLHLMTVEGWDEDEAIEWIDYNTLRACPYYEKAPIIMYGLEEDWPC